MENDKKTSFQAHVLRTAILARMLEKGSHFLDIKSQLSTLLEDSFISLDASSSKPCTDFEEFVKQLIRTDDVGCKDHPSKILARMQFFLTGKWTINLVKKLEMELHALKTFWVAA